MSGESRNGPNLGVLTIRLQPSNLSVSYLSSLLRVVQAAVREVARSDDGTRPIFDRNPQPILELSRLETDDGLTLYFTFTDPQDGTSLNELSSQAFDALLDRFGEFVRGLPQPGLWGGAANRSAQRPFEDELTRRMDQLYREMRRSPRATMRAQGRTIEIEGDRMEIA